MANLNSMTNYHDQAAESLVWPIYRGHWDTQFTYTFENFFHPLVGELISELNKDALSGMLDATFQKNLTTDFFQTLYNPTENLLTHVEFFPKEIDVDEHRPYANYNWELLFHIPLTIAVHLSKTQRFAEALRWFHYIFDPTSNDMTVEPPQRFWKFLAFRQDPEPKQIDYLLSLLSKRPEALTPDDQNRRKGLLDGYTAILNKPFQPHVVARTRHLAYQYSVFMKYLDNLIAWGDSLFQQDTMESINEATLRYVLAANLLGPRPQQVPPLGTTRPQTFAQLKAAGLDQLGNALVEMEGNFPFNLMPSSGTSGDSSSARSLFGIGHTLYFCIPRNAKMLGYWDTVADRLFKIRHCMNIAGVVRPLALFDPPLDPGMLVKAAAAGIDIGSIVNGLNQPIGPVRCITLIQKALELCGEVRGFGGALLSALEKGDSEHLALIHQRHEIQIQQMTQEVRFLQWKAAQETTTSLLTSRETTLERLHYYQRLLGLPADQNAPDTLTLDRSELTEESFDDTYSLLVDQYDKQLTMQNFPDLKLTGNTSPAQQSGASGQGNLYLISNENAELNEHLPSAKQDQAIAFVSRQIAPVFSLLPTFSTDFHFWGIGGTIVFGGEALTKNIQSTADIMDLMASMESHDANSANKTASYQRRADDWMLQYNLATHELKQIGRQVLTSLIAEQIAHHEYMNTQQQIANAQEIAQFYHDKFTNEELYLWMQGEISRLYYEYYRFAFDTARKAERTMKQELMRPEVDAQDFVKFNYWDGGRKGLLSGEALYLDIKRMEMAYLDNNKRELELTRHVSLRQLDPLALITLKTTGTCQVTIPEWLYDLDCPGHYMRRMKSVALSIPSVVGPYTSVNCTLSLLKSSLRKSPIVGDDYARQGSQDDRFVDYIGSVQSIVTSGASIDSGMFETNLRDERFLPFEGAGAESTWKLELPSDFRPFDYMTISDVILHIRYTARQGVDSTKVNVAINELFKQATLANLALLFSLRYDFPTEWARFQGQKPGNNQRFELALNLRPEHYPYWSQGRLKSVKRVDILARSTKASLDIFDKVDQNDMTVKKDSLARDTAFGNLLVGKLTQIALPTNPVGEFQLFFDDNTMEDVWIAVTWGNE
jgi:hypothetical protein